MGVISPSNSLERRVAAFMVALSVQLFGCFSPALAQLAPIVAVGSLATGLDVLDQHIQAAINNARNAGEQLEVDLGGQIANEIAFARTQFHDELGQDLVNIVGPAKTFYDTLVQTVTDFEAKAYQDAAALLAQGQTIMNIVPFRNDDPQVSYVESDLLYKPDRPGAENVLIPIVIHGNFVDAGQWPPTLTLGNARYRADATTQRLTFNIPVTSLQFPSSSIAQIPATLDAPFHRCYFLWLFNCDHTQTFSESLWLLPTNAGSVDYTITRPYLKYVTETRTETQHVDASNGDNRGYLVKFNARSADGWAIVDGSVWYTLANEHGDLHMNSNCSTVTTACWNVDVIQHHWPNCCDGTMDVTLHWVEYKNVSASALQNSRPRSSGVTFRL